MRHSPFEPLSIVVSLIVSSLVVVVGDGPGGGGAPLVAAARPGPPHGRPERDETTARGSRWWSRPTPSIAEEARRSSSSSSSSVGAAAAAAVVPPVRGGVVVGATSEGRAGGDGDGGNAADDGPDAYSAATAAAAFTDAAGEASPSSSSGEVSDSETVSRMLSKVRRWMHEREEEEREQESDSRRPALCPSPLPFVTLSYAQTLDGMIGLSLPSSSSSSSGGEAIRSSNLPISGDESMVLTHAMRSVHDAVLVGCGTMLADDPRLTVRLWGGDGRGHQPRPVVLDTELRCLPGPRSGSALSSPPPRNGFRARDVIVCCSDEAAEEYHRRLRRQEDEGGGASSSSTSSAAGGDGGDEELIGIGGEGWTLLPCRRRRLRRSDGTGGGGLDLVDVLRRLKSVHGIRSVMVEGGSSVLSSFVDAGTDDGDEVGPSVVDCLCVTISPSILGGRFGLHAFRDVGFNGNDRDGVNGGAHQMRRLCDVSYDVLGSDCVLLGRWPRSGDGRT